MGGTEKIPVYREFRCINPCSHTNNPCKVLGGVGYFGESGINQAGISRDYCTVFYSNQLETEIQHNPSLSGVQSGVTIYSF
jgi:hypothetical protein